jgi:hypothetical protein
MRKKENTEPQGPRKPVRMISQVHIHAPERGRLCGCPRCLDLAGLEIVEVLNERTGQWRTMLVNWFSVRDIQPDLLGTEEPDSLDTPAEEE